MSLPSIDQIRIGIIGLVNGLGTLFKELELDMSEVLAVPHEEVVALGVERFEALLRQGGLIYDLKSILPPRAGRVRI